MKPVLKIIFVTIFSIFFNARSFLSSETMYHNTMVEINTLLITTHTSHNDVCWYECFEYFFETNGDKHTIWSYWTIPNRFMRKSSIMSKKMVPDLVYTQLSSKHVLTLEEDNAHPIHQHHRFSWRILDIMRWWYVQMKNLLFFTY